jgi:tetratricopeptide (TPR) repeat protein
MGMSFRSLANLALVTVITIACNAQTSENKAIDDVIAISNVYRDAGLFTQAKEILIEKFSEDPNGAGMDRIYYELGVILFFEGEIERTTMQWRRLLELYPNSMWADHATDIMNELSLTSEMDLLKTLDDVAFNEQIDLSHKFWNFRNTNKMSNWSELVNPWHAYEYYESLRSKYDDPTKQITILYLQFLLTAGMNSDNFGYRHSNSTNISNRKLLERCVGEDAYTDRSTSQSTYERRMITEMQKEAFRNECDRLLLRMTRIDSTSWLVVDAYFRMAVLTGGSSFGSGDLEVNEVSARYFKKVLELLPEDNVNFRRVFASFWVSEFEDN